MTNKFKKSTFAFPTDKTERNSALKDELSAFDQDLDEENLTSIPFTNHMRIPKTPRINDLGIAHTFSHEV
jgi:hypothetical protein